MKPFLFNTDMVKAIKNRLKTFTRRCIKYRSSDGLKPVPSNAKFVGIKCGKFTWETEDSIISIKAPCQIGDILYVRETWQKHRIKKPQKAVPDDFKEIQYSYKADGELANSDGSPFVWRPSIHMPKDAARIFLRVTHVRVERLMDITQEDALKEGGTGVPCDCSNIDEHGCVDCFNTGWIEPPTIEFMWLWDSTIKPADLPVYGWSANPWVWVIEFEKISKEEATKC